MTGQHTTFTGADGEKTTLAFGADFVFGISGPQGRDDVVSGRLESRAANGDLVVLVDSSGTTKRVRPSKILSVHGTGVEVDPSSRPSGGAEGYADEPETDSRPMVPDRLDGETSAKYLARLERELGSRYEAFVESPTGQETLARVAAEDRASRKGAKLVSLDDRLEAEVANVLEPLRVPFVAIAGGKTTKTTKRGRAKLAAVGVTDPPAELPAGKTVRIGRAYSDRNQVWKCGICKTRTRKPVCEGRPGGAHPPVSAPAGKRREERTR